MRHVASYIDESFISKRCYRPAVTNRHIVTRKYSRRSAPGRSLYAYHFASHVYEVGMSLDRRLTKFDIGSLASRL